MRSPKGLKRRSSGVLLHPTSLRGRLGQGGLGPEARLFIDFLSDTHQSWWQMLPLNAPAAEYSPYRGESAFAANPLLISPDDLADWGLLKGKELPGFDKTDLRVVDFRHAERLMSALLKKAFRTFESDSGADERRCFDDFCSKNAFWLEDYALFKAIAKHTGKKKWTLWPAELRLRHKSELNRFHATSQHEIRYICFVQYLFHRQWSELSAYAHARGIGLIGDLPIFVDSDSADVWSNSAYFQLDTRGRPKMLAGVPPDYFSTEGQFWGNPLYDWERLRDFGYDWWIQRFAHNTRLFDLVRIDHFRGFAAAWGVPAGSRTARNGKWMPGPGEDLFRRAEEVLGSLPVIAEDLGLITPDVVKLRRKLSFPGMRVLQFGFGGPTGKSIHLPHRYIRRSVAYTGTHDNDTLQGWYRSLPRKLRAEVRTYTRSVHADIHWGCIQAVWASVADLAIVPMQDVLGLGSECRMNTPGTSSGNWTWKLKSCELDGANAQRLATITELYGR